MPMIEAKNKTRRLIQGTDHVFTSLSGRYECWCPISTDRVDRCLVPRAVNIWPRSIVFGSGGLRRKVWLFLAVGLGYVTEIVLEVCEVRLFWLPAQSSLQLVLQYTVFSKSCQLQLLKKCKELYLFLCYYIGVMNRLLLFFKTMNIHAFFLYLFLTRLTVFWKK